MDESISGQALTAAAAEGSISVDLATLQAVEIQPPPTIAMQSNSGSLLWAIHPDGRMEFGDDYNPDDAARAFWDAVTRLTPTLAQQQFGAPLAARIDAELADLKTRAAQAEELQRAAHQARAAAEQRNANNWARAERAEAALARIQDLADQHPVGIDTALIHAALDTDQPEEK